MSARWITAVLDPQITGGLAVARSPDGFLLDDNGALFPRDWLKRQDLDVLCEQGIGHFDGEPVFLLELRSASEVPGCHWRGLRSFMLEGDFETYKILGYAAQIGTWAREHRFCGSCGQPMTQIRWERAMYCQPCDLRSYPRISPSMIVLVTRGDEILLARSPRFVSGVYSTLAGFAEPGESAEDCLVREVREEVAVEVKDIQYIGSQCWPFPHSMMLGFHAEYAGGEIVMQPDEIEDAKWFSVHELPPLPAGRSIARYLIDLYVARRLGLPEPVLPR
ncbi:MULTISPECIES: NAD(+) diphosphatase [Pseudomonas]|uniref:NAD-capped RNA hydrolase NudC n=1 Tax=Pseudomonas taiwanensis TaxID=470150 RepID=A0ABR6V3J9_9PSED|nr:MULTISPECIES: NAD(+) diphosphatase [Pseudomonas]AGZ34807.1 NADH pyrophosphatase [Pseudomonas sp. VLB120]AVD85839.1 NAD(+) diphosphatase [Pseudomonas sp. SWI44]MBC3475091.1 NAD(+) diphosphatase [Pseudomonas taiwanensis]MBC3490297.1 NAD(+) diphosphatase [Pseudomonas taiwanensis]MDT8923247.1 NAD(+) diphosphatase [Pseudomonas taiwanensis]